MTPLNLNNSFTFGGKIHKIGKVETVPTKTGELNKREFIIEQTQFTKKGDSFTEYAKFELLNGNCAKVDGFKKGDYVNVRFNLKGNLWKDKEAQKAETAIMTLQAWEVDAAE